MGTKSIQIREIVKDYSGRRVLDGVSFEVAQGAIHGFLGPNGAGKSTTINIVTGLFSPSSGDVLIDGDSVVRLRKRACGRVGLLPENLPLYPNMRVRDYLQFCRDIGSFRSRTQLAPMGDILDKCGLVGGFSALDRKFEQGVSAAGGDGPSIGVWCKNFGLG